MRRGRRFPAHPVSGRDWLPFRSRVTRRRVGTGMVLSLMAAGLGVVTVTAMPPAPAEAAPALDCGSVYALRGQSPRDLWSVNTGTGGLTTLGTFDIANATGNLNGLGVTDDGSAAFGVLPANSGTGRTVYRLLRSSEATTSLGAGVASAEVTHGAVNPANNFYYYGGFSNAANGAGTLSVYGFNTATNTSIGLVARGSVPAGGANGDFAFDQLGRLYVTGGASGTNVLTSINETIPTTAQATPVALTGTRISTIPTPSEQAVNGIAFGGNGLLYLASQQQLFEVQASTGSVVNTRTLSVQGASVDLASCARPSTIVVRKSFPQGRASAGDQATVTVAGPNLGSGNTSGTTQGSEVGVQDQVASEYAGPVFGTSGTTYTISESGTGTREASPSQNGYTRAWSCVNATSNNAVVASGTGTSGQFTMPASGVAGANVVCTFTNTAQVSALTLDKTAGSPSGNTVGSTIRYELAVTNSGTVPLNNVTVTDPKVGPVTCGSGALAVGATRACTAVTYTLTQDDVDAGRVDNTASASATATGLPNATGTDSTSTTITGAPALSLTKRAGTPTDSNGNGLVDAGDRIPYTFEVRNTGNVRLTGLAIGDAKVGGTTCDATALAPNATTTCRTTTAYTITAADQTAGAVDNSATASATTPSGGSVTSNRSTTSTPLTTPNPALSLTKRVGTITDTNASGLTDAGDTIAYTFDVTNSGNVRVTGLVINDAKVGATTCTATTLAVGATTTCRTSAPYTITAADQASGAVANTATASATPAGGGTVTSPSSTTRTPVATPNPRLTITKRAATPVDRNSSGLTDAGDTIRYSFTVTNPGNVPIRNVAISDPLLSGLTPPITTSCTATTLAPNASTECATSGPYSVTEADETAGRVVNTATATGTSPDNASVQSASSSVTTTVTLPAPKLTLTKRVGTVTDVDGSGITDAGDTVAYEFTVRNTGNVPITGVAIADPEVTSVTCDATRLAVDASTTCRTTTPYTITAADERAGVASNTATATGADPDGGLVTSDPSTANVPTTAQSAVLTLVKRADPPADLNESGLTDAGDTVGFRFTVTNDGNVPVQQITISDPRAPPVTCQATSLAPGASTTCATSSPYVLTAADERAGSAVNTATATGTVRNRGTVTSNQSSATVGPVVAATPSLSIDKQVSAPADRNGSGITDAGDRLTYTFVVTNTGNVALQAVGVTDSRLTGLTCPTGPLLPGASRTCTADVYVITPADEAAGAVDNTASARATAPGVGTGPRVPVTSPTDSTSTPVTTPVTAVSLTKTAGAPVDRNGSGITDAGDTIAYSFRVTNDGNVPLSGVAVNDQLLAGVTPPIVVTCTDTTLAPRASTDCSAGRPYVVTEADETAGRVRNTATAAGTDPDDDRVTSAPATTSTPVTTPAPALTFDKTAGAPVDANRNGLVDAGDTIRYSFTVTNSGNVPVSGVAVADDRAGSVTCGRTTLGPGQSTTCEADARYRITPADEAAGAVDNTASASGRDPDGARVTSPTDTTSTPVVAADPALTMVKNAGTPVDVNGSGIVDAGDTIDYTFDVTNDGNVPLQLLRIDDPTVGSVTCDVTDLTPGQATVCRTITPYVVTADDERAGEYANSAEAVADVVGGGEVRSPEDTTTTEVTPPDPQLEIDKQAGTPVDVNSSGIVDAGDTVLYSFTVTNTGNVPLDDVAVDDALLSGLDPAVGVTCEATSLAVSGAGATTECTADAPYTITEADEVAGLVTNVATATGTDPDGGPVESAEDRTTTTTVLGDPDLAIEKSAAVTDVNDSEITDAGDTIAYTFVVTNTGNVPVSGLAVADPLAGGVTCEADSLDPGEETTCTADDAYVVTADDETAAVVRNTATVSGTGPGVGAGPGEPVTSDPGSTNVGVTDQAAVLTLTKTASDVVDANDSGLPDAGDEITYSFTVVNDGNVAITDVVIVDDLLTDQDPTVTVTCTVPGQPTGQPPTLRPGQSADCTASGPYVVTDADTQAGEVVNVATAEGEGPDGPVVSNEAQATSEPVIPAAPSLTIEKRAAPPVDRNDSGITDAGDTIGYTFRVTNTGNVPVRQVTVTDDLLTGVGCPRPRLDPGAAMTCTADDYVVTADDEGGDVVNEATVAGLDPDDGDVTAGPSTTTTPVQVPDPELTIDKQVGTPEDVNGSGLVDAGDRIGYRFVVQNTGNVPITVLRVVDPTIGTVACENVTIPAGQSFECLPLAPYVVTEEDEARGSVENAAFVRGEDPDGALVRSTFDRTSTEVDSPVAALTLTKTADTPDDVNGSGLVDAGDTVGWSFTVTNDGTVPLTTLRVADPLVGPVTCQATSLPVGGSTTCSADDPTVVTEADERAGEVVNTATARANDPDGVRVADDAEASVDVATPAPALEIDKQAADPVDVNGSGLVDAGDTVLYTFTVTNTGNVPLDAVAVDDPLLAGLDPAIGVTCAADTLGTGEDDSSTTCTADAPYTITTADELAGKAVNRATALGEDPDGGDVVSGEDTTRTTVAAPERGLTVVKSEEVEDVNGSGITDAGDEITYSFTVTNTGTVPLADVAIDDVLLAGVDPAITVTCAADELGVSDPGDTTTCTADAPYVVTDADVEAGLVSNTATATATAPGVGGGARVDVVSDPDTVNVPTTRQAAVLTLDKTAADPVDVNDSGITDAGDTIDYTFTVTNDGNVPVSAITIDDPLLDGLDPANEITCAPQRLAPGAEAECEAARPYVVTADDEAAGRVLNTASAGGLGPDGDDVTSNEDTTTTPVTAQVTTLTFDKVAAEPVDRNGSGLVDAGDTIAYSFTVTNVGNVPVTGVIVSDPTVGAVTCAPTTLAPGAVATCEADADYVVTVDDETAGEVVNEASASAVGPDGPGDVVTSPTDTTTTDVDSPRRVLVVDKVAADPVDANDSGQTDAGDTIAYSFTVTNDGNVTVTDVAVADALLAEAGLTITCEAAELAPGEDTACTTSDDYVITPADEAAGVVDNSATAAGAAPGTGGGPRVPVVSDPDTTQTTVVEPTPQLELDKAASVEDVNSSGLTDTGDEITYTFTVTNDGNVTVRDLEIDDDLLAGLTPPVTVTCTDTRLVAGATTTCTAQAPYVVTAADEAAGSVDNEATATAVRVRGGDPVTSPADSISTPVVTPVTSLTLEKTAAAPVDANDSGLVDAGDTVRYTFTVTNGGNVPVSDLRIDDDLLAGLDPAIGVSCEDRTLAAGGGTTTCTADAPYRITTADEDAGEVVNTATATASDPDGDDVVSPEDSTESPVDAPAPALGLEKTADAVDVNGSGATDAGDTIAYSFAVTNDGDVPLNGVGIDDELLAGLTPAITVTCEETVLAVGAGTTCTADAPYVVTAADERAGSVDNEATAVAGDPDGEPVTSASDDTSTRTQVAAPSVSIDKSLPEDGIDDVEGDGIVDAGDTITYAFTVTNTGNVPVTDLVVVDPLLADADPTITVACAAEALEPGQSTTCEQSAPYVVTTADEDARAVTNSATAEGTAPGVGDGPRVDVVSDPDVARVGVTAEADVLTLAKSAADPVDVNGSGLVDAGDTIAYSFTVTNDGNVTLDELVVDDPLLDGVTCEATTLAPGDSTECTADDPYVVTGADERAGEVVNTAVARAATPGGAPSVSNEDSTRTFGLVVPEPGLRIDKTAAAPVDVNGSGLTDAGDTIAYTFRVTNAGNVPVTDVAVDDALLGGLTPPVTVTCEATELAPGRGTDCAADAPYVVTAADQAAGSVDNAAAATATDPDDEPVRSPEDSTSTPVQTPVVGLVLEKEAADPVDVNDSGLTDAGDTIAYTFTVTNTGTVPVRALEVRDPLLDAEEVDVSCDTATLAPGASTGCAADAPYTVTAVDELTGEVLNVATAAATDPDGDEVVSEPDTTTTPAALPAPALSVEKSADVDDVNDSGLTDVGDEVTYAFVVVNTGDVPVREVGIDDGLLSAQQPPVTVTCADTTLAPGARTTCTAADAYVVTAADEGAGVLRNTAAATGVDPDDEPVVSDPDTEVVPTASGAPVLVLDKEAGTPVDVNDSGITDAGDTIVYTFTVTNVGDTPARAVRILDPMLADAGLTTTCETRRLGPGEDTTCEAAAYTVTEADEDAGEVLNTATASGLDPDGDTVRSNEDSTRTPVTAPERILGLVKTAGDPVDVNDSGITDAGDTIAYSFEVTNDGNVPVTVLRVDDPLLAAQDPPITVSCSPVRIAPGEVSSCEADAPYVVTGADEEAGEVVNSARATAIDVDGDAVVSGRDEVRTAIGTPDPALSLVKTAGDPFDSNGSGLVDAGDTVAYTFTVTNTGNVPVRSVSVDDALLAGLDPAIGVTCEATRLAPGEETECAADAPYVITDADEQAGEVINVANARGADPDGDSVASREATTTTEVDSPAPGLELDKTVVEVIDIDDSGQTDAGDEIRWRFVVTNTGTVPVGSVAIDDPRLDGTEIACDRPRLPAPGDGVAPGLTRTVCLPADTYVITDADVAAGEVVNTATATGVDPDGAAVVSEEDSTRTPVQAVSGDLVVEKSATVRDANGSGLTDAGDEISYSFRVLNDGNVTLRQVQVVDRLLRDASPTIDVSCDATRLVAGASTTCRAEAPYVVTAADEAAGSVDNTATARAVRGAEDRSVVSAPDGTSTPVVVPGPALEVVKSAAVTDVNDSGLTDAGDEIAYAFTVTNTGDVPLTAVGVDDERLAALDPAIAVTCADTTLAPGASTSCSAEAAYVVTVADERAGSVDNTASAVAADPDGEPVVSPTDFTSTATEVPRAGLVIDKSLPEDGIDDVAGDGIVDAGDRVTFAFTVTNDGTVPVSDVAVADELLTDAGISVTCEVTSLAPGGSTTCVQSALYVVTADDEDARVLTNTASAEGTAPGVGDGPRVDVVSDPDTVRVPVTAEADVLTLAKSAADPVDVNDSGIVDAGDTIAYSFTVTNDGNVRIDDVVVDDALLDGAGITVSCEVTTLAPGESTDCTADEPYVVTEADETAGEVVNTAVARGATPGGTESVSNEATTRTTGVEVPDPSLRLDKTAGDPVDVNDSGLTDAGDTIAYRFTVTNTGTVPVTGVAVDDDLLAGLDPAIAVTCEATELAPGAAADCAADAPYVITEADEAAGSVDNAAAATAVDPDDGPVRSTQDSTSTPVQTPATGLTVDKTAGDPVDVNDSGLTDAGDTIGYTFTVTNTGTVPVTDLEVRDPLLASQEIAVTCSATTLAAGDSTRCRTSTPYVVTTVDELEGEVLNVARAAGTDPDGGAVGSEADSTRTPVELPAPSLGLEKSADVADVNDSGLSDAGDEVSYTFTVTNTGTVPVRRVAVEDDLLEGQDPPITVTCEATRLAPGASTECAADAPYVITAADERAGVLRNTATATGVDPDSEPVVSDPDSVAVPTAEGTAVLSLDKLAADPVDVNESGITDAGDTVVFTFTVTNDGDVPVTRVRVADPLLVEAGVRVTCEATRLAPGASTQCEAAPYTVTEADEDAGEVLNVAAASGLDPDGDTVRSNDDSTRTPVTAPERVLELVKTAGDPVDVNGSGIVDAGDTIAYTFEVTNAGNVPVTVLRIDDPLLTEQDPPSTISCSPVRLVPGETAACEADTPYVITDADEEAGEVVNSARATAVSDAGEPVVSGRDSTRTDVSTPDPSLGLEKTAGDPVDVNDSGITDAGDTVAYTFTVTNTGNVPVRSVSVDDALLAGLDPAIGVTCEATRLAPGEETECAADAPYVITDADEIAGEVVNVANARGADVDGGPVGSEEASTRTPVAGSRPSLVLDKRVGSVVDLDQDGFTDAGDEIRWRLVVTNTGNVPVSAIGIDDPLLDGTDIVCELTRLLPVGEGVDPDQTRTVCLPADAHVVTEADEAVGEVVNTATAAGVDPDGLPVDSDEASTRTPVRAPSPSVRLEKDALPVVDRDGDGTVGEGDAVSYVFTVVNTGDVRLLDLEVSDPLLAAQTPAVGVRCDADELPVGGSTTCRADAPYLVTADDVDAGRVVNLATVEGTDPDSDQVDDEAGATVPVGGPAPAALGLVKAVESVTDVDGDGLTGAGDEIVYRFTVTNSSPTLTLDDPEVDDALLDAAGVDVTCEGDSLPPASADGTPSSTTCTSAPYTITEADETAGQVVNTARATATDPDGGPLTSEDDSTTTVVTVPVARLDLDKSGVLSDANGNGQRDAGDTVRFTFTVTNTGNVPLTDVAVDDDMLAGLGIAVSCPDTALTPGEVVTCEAAAPYRVTAGDQRAGEVVNVAAASGEGPDGTVTDSEEATEEVVLDGVLGPDAELTLDKRYVSVTDVDGNGRASAGDTLLYEFDVTNTGRVEVTDIEVVDPMIPDVECPTTTLAPGETMTCRGTYTLTAADADRDRVRNVARAEGEGADGPVQSGSDGVVVRLVDAEPLPPAEPGDPGYPVPSDPGDPGDPGGDGLLPDTGGPAAWVALIGLLLLGGGIGALLWSRRRRSPGRTGRHAREREVRT